MPQWRNASMGFVRENAVQGGNDSSGEPLFVGRANESGDLIPGKIVSSHGVCYVAYGGGEKTHRNYEYLVTPAFGSLDWIPAGDGQIPYGAVHAGRTGGGEDLFVGRAYYEGSLVIGKVQRSHQVLYVPYDGREVSITDYEVLVYFD